MLPGWRSIVPAHAPDKCVRPASTLLSARSTSIRTPSVAVDACEPDWYTEGLARKLIS